MRYIEFHDGAVALASGNAISHRDLLRLVGRCKSFARSAGFLGARYDVNQPWEPYGFSTGLALQADEKLNIPEHLFVAIHKYGQVYASCPAMLGGLSEVQPAVWCVSEESLFGDVCPVFAPMHPKYKLRADEVLSR